MQLQATRCVLLQNWPEFSLFSLQTIQAWRWEMIINQFRIDFQTFSGLTERSVGIGLSCFIFTIAQFNFFPLEIAFWSFPENIYFQCHIASAVCVCECVFFSSFLCWSTVSVVRCAAMNVNRIWPQTRVRDRATQQQIYFNLQWNCVYVCFSESTVN